MVVLAATGHLKVRTIRGAIDSGVHLICLDGHGGPAGCCGVYTQPFDGAKPEFIRPDFWNDRRYSIVFSSSCYTARPSTQWPLADKKGPSDRSLGEYMVLDPKGGAVAYLGFTQIGDGDSQVNQTSFWSCLKAAGRPGPAADDPRTNAKLYHRYVQMLYGDPEMPVWTGVPQTYQLIHPASVAHGEEFVVTVLHDNVPVKGQKVTFSSNWTRYGKCPDFLKTTVTDAFGRARCIAPPSLVIGDPVTNLRVTVTPDFAIREHPNFKPGVADIQVLP